ncbi:MAG TPA: hypothetical protein PK819_11150, partial [Thermomicrobiales bacterium]|nr:hypothetical protein [Thermomicrobiales bacterium]
AVAGQIVRTSSIRAAGGPDLISAITSPLMRLLVGLVTGLLLVLFVPIPVVGAAEVIRTRFGGSMAMGFITILTWPILVVALTVIVIGIPLALIGTILLFCIGWLSQIFVGLALGRAILPRGWKQQSRGYNILALAIGMILIGAVRMAPIPFVPAVVALVVLLIGIGGVILAIHAGASAMRNQPARA